MSALNLTDNLTIDGQVVNLAITQGKTYQFSIGYPADLSIGELRGQIKTKYAQDDGELLATFSFNVSYDPVELKSLVVIKLEATATALIPYTKYQGTGDITLRNAYVYDIEYEENDTVIELLRGLVQVKAEATI